MRHFELIAYDLNVAPVMAQLKAHPELWNAHPGRTNEDSPHYGVDDIWLRYRALDELTEPVKFIEPHFAVFYPAWRVLTALHPIVRELMSRPYADGWPVYLGGILLTRIPPGGRVKPHHDRGSWHAENMNTKIYVGLQSNEQCVNHCEDESVTIREGEAWTFNNLRTHSVENNGKTDRVTAIVCLMCQR